MNQYRLPYKLKFFSVKKFAKDKGRPKNSSPSRVLTPPRDSQPKKVTPPRSPVKHLKPQAAQTPKSSDALSPEHKKKTPKSPEKATRRSSISNSSQLNTFDPKNNEKTPNSKNASTPKQRSLSSSTPKAKEVKSPDDLKWAIKTLQKKDVVQAFKNGVEKLPITGFIPGQLEQATAQASKNPKLVDELARQLYGSCTFAEDGRASILDEINGKRGIESALIKAGKRNSHIPYKTETPNFDLKL